MVVADDLECVPLYRVEDVLKSYLIGLSLKCIAALRSSGAFNDFSLSELLKDLLRIGKIQSLSLRDLCRPDRWGSIALCEIEGTEYSALSPFCDSHGNSLPLL